MRFARLVLIAVVLILASCANSNATPIATAEAVLGISNGTTLDVSLVVNGTAVATATPGVAVAPIPFSKLPPLPWTVEARSPSGRILTTMAVASGNVTSTAYADGHTGTTGTFGRVDLSCGRLTIWAGFGQPSGPPPPSPAGSPGDCAP